MPGQQTSVLLHIHAYLGREIANNNDKNRSRFIRIIIFQIWFSA